MKLGPRHEAAKQALSGDRETVTILYGKAGTGKTYTSLEAAVEWLGGNLESTKKNGKKKIIFIRPNEPFARSIGYLKGTEEEKMRPWVAPVLDSLTAMGYEDPFIMDAISRGVIQVVPLEFIQGRTFHDSFIIMDEAQNATYEQQWMVMTRVGRWSKLVYCGDTAQVSDSVKHSGFHSLIKNCEDLNVNMVKFLEEDNMRGPISKMGLTLSEMEH